MREPFAVYVHVPWCRHVCPYCDFNVYAAAEPPERPYVAALVAELAAHAAAPPWHGRPAATVYLGGGGEPVVVAPVGLDGVFRFSTLPTDGGRLVGFRGEWIDPQTFVMEYNGVVSNDQVALQLVFEGDRVAVTASNAVGQPGVELEGRFREP